MLKSSLTLDTEHRSREFRTPVKTARGNASRRESIVLTLRHQNGKIGRGEIAPWEGFGCESLDDARTALRALAGTLLPENPTDLPAAAPENCPCTRHALAAAAFFLENPDAAEAPEPPENAVCRLIPRRADDVPDALFRKILQHAAASGTRAFKIKIGFDALENEIALCRKLLETAAQAVPEIRLRFDANGAWNTPAALDAFVPLTAFPQLEFIEQPLAATPENDAAVLALPRERAAKIALDESLREPWKLPDETPVIAVVKPLLIGDFFRLRRWLSCGNAPKFVISSVFETDAGRAVLRHLYEFTHRNPRALDAGIATREFFRAERA